MTGPEGEKGSKGSKGEKGERGKPGPSGENFRFHAFLMHSSTPNSINGEFESLGGFKHFTDTGAKDWLEESDLGTCFIAEDIGCLNLDVHLTWHYTQHQKIVQVMLKKEDLDPVVICETYIHGTTQAFSVSLGLEAGDKVYLRAKRDVSDINVHVNINGENTILRAGKSSWLSGTYTVGY